jgi:hypothetical protein
MPLAISNPRQAQPDKYLAPPSKSLRPSGDIFANGPPVGLRNNCEAMPKISQICNLIASLEMEPHDAELLRKMMCDFRTRHSVAYRDLMKIPGIDRLWTTTEALAMLSCIKREGGGLG